MTSAYFCLRFFGQWLAEKDLSKGRLGHVLSSIHGGRFRLVRPPPVAGDVDAGRSRGGCLSSWGPGSVTVGRSWD